ncbi:PAS domain S-box protein [Salinibacter altiplanensis]|uniref:sensor histidine kinase n=1 Tax=Salinibacter altiplanensis TaxID=1803181 RepID=UPI001E52D4F2|nr:PAS domain S-box protein [Salinibacter altiplanensis]
MSLPVRRIFLCVGLGLLSGALFLLDWMLPIGATVEMLQVAVILLTLFLPGQGATLGLGLLTTVFVGLGCVLKFEAFVPPEALMERGLVLAGLWTAVAVVLRYKRVRQAQRESEAKAQAILETTVDGIITIDAGGIIESFNEAAENIFGYDAEEVIGQNVKVLMPPPYRDEHDEYLRSYHETGRKRIIGVGREVWGRRKDGSTFPMDLAVSEVELGDRTLFTGIVRDISERRRLEKEILEISEEERRRIGQDLHDGLGQMLTGIGLLSQDLARHLDDEGHERAEDMAEITDHVKEADQYARDLSHGLIPVDVEANGLTEALRRLSQNAVRMFGVECSFREVDTVLVHNSTVATHLYRIAQEAVSNAVRHGDANDIKVILASGDEQIRLQVRDNGTGFAPDVSDESGMGIHIMQYRARIIGGALEITSELGDGTVVTSTIPRSADVAVEDSPAPMPAKS